jgi:hypothetical protein
MSSASSKAPRRWRRKWIALLSIVVAGIGVGIFYASDFTLLPYRHASTVLVLDNCDDDYKTRPFEDAVIAFGAKGRASRLVTNLNICQTIGGSRLLSVSADGAQFFTCENVANRLTAYSMKDGRRVWEHRGEFTAATPAPDGGVYAIVSAGTIYGKETLLFDAQGLVTKRTDAAGFDLALDLEHGAVWLVGNRIRKCDLDLNVLLEITPIRWCASSVDVSPDGSVWVTEREHPNVTQSSNRVLRISTDGKILQAIPLEWTPGCVRVDRSDGSAWVTGGAARQTMTSRVVEAIEKRAGKLPLSKKLRASLLERRSESSLAKFDRNGKLLCHIPKGGHTLDIDQSDGSVWLAASGRLYHFSRDGKKLGVRHGLSDDEQYVAVVPPNNAPVK